MGSWLVRDGAPHSVVVCPPEASTLQREAVAEFNRIVEKSTGTKLPVIAPEEAASLPPATLRLFVGDTAKAVEMGLDNLSIAPETYHILRKGNTLCIIGSDTASEKNTPASRPTLWALNSLLEEGLGVRWLWPGELGTFVPKQKDFPLPQALAASEAKLTYQPALQIRSLRMSLSKGSLAVADKATDARLRAEAILWAENHQVGRRGDIRLGHAFSHWWDKYSANHPDYFAELPPGFNAPHPLPGRAKLRLANPAVIEQIAQEYEQAGKPEYWNVCPNDGNGFDISEATRAWDLPSGQSPQQIFSSKANLTARYVEFWNRLYKRLQEINPDVTLVTYAYSAYRLPPPPERPLKAKAVIGIVDTYNTYENWKGWASDNTRLVLRPNWWHQGADAPYLPLGKAARYLKFAHANGMIGLDMDSIIGYWATQGINYYLGARLMTRSNLALETILDEYTQAFGSAAPKIREYLAYWEAVADKYNYPLNAANEPPERLRGAYHDLVRQRKVSASILNGSTQALPHLYGKQVIAPARRLLAEGEALLKEGEEEARARIAFLLRGLESLELTRNQVALGSTLKDQPNNSALARFQEGASRLERERERLSMDHAIWAAAATRREMRYRVLIWPENLPHHKINLDGL